MIHKLNENFTQNDKRLITDMIDMYFEYQTPASGQTRFNDEEYAKMKQRESSARKLYAQWGINTLGIDYAMNEIKESREEEE